MAYTNPICRSVKETELPPFQASNHTIPLIDESKTYPWRASRCPEIFRKQWVEKRDAYLKSGHWKMTTARNTMPMMLIPKPHKPKDAQELHMVIDLHERNKNTKKMSSLLHSTPVGKMTNFDHQNKFQQIYRSDREDEWCLIKPKIMNFGGPVLEI